MAQLSRPYQIGLVAVALLAAAWLLLFQGHHSSPSSATSSPPAPATRTVTAPTAAPKAKSQANAGQATGHGSASSLGGLGHAVEKARGAVTTSEKNAKELQAKSAQASSQSTSSASKAAGAGAASHAKTTTAPPATVTKTTTHVKTHAGAAAPTRQRTVEAQLAKGRIALILFWNPKGSDDRAVHNAIGRLPHNLRYAVDAARPSEVASFGSITRGVQVYGTPTLLVVDRKGTVTTLTGLQDSFTIAQAIREARHS